MNCQNSVISRKNEKLYTQGPCWVTLCSDLINKKQLNHRQKLLDMLATVVMLYTNSLVAGFYNFEWLFWLAIKAAVCPVKQPTSSFPGSRKSWYPRWPDTLSAILNFNACAGDEQLLCRVLRWQNNRVGLSVVMYAFNFFETRYFYLTHEISSKLCAQLQYLRLKKKGEKNRLEPGIWTHDLMCDTSVRWLF